MKKFIKDIVNIQTGIFARPAVTGELVYLQTKHFDKFGNLHSALHPDLPCEGVSEKHLLKKGDVLLVAKGTKNFATVFENHNLLAVASTSFLILRVSDENVLPDYLVWFLNHPTTQALLKSKARGTSIPSIRKAALDEIEISIPPVEKQKLIMKLSKFVNKETEIRNQLTDLKKQLIEQIIINEINNRI